MKKTMGEVIYQSRLNSGLTQDQFAARYEVSGPAVFKFEKGYVMPSLALWLRMALDAGVEERDAVMLWAKGKLPEKFQDHLDMAGAANAPMPAGLTNYASFEDPQAMMKAACSDSKLPKGLRELLDDKDLWSVFKPTGAEINLLRDIFGTLKKGARAPKSAWVDALRLLREFTKAF